MSGSFIDSPRPPGRAFTTAEGDKCFPKPGAPDDFEEISGSFFGEEIFPLDGWNPAPVVMIWFLSIHVMFQDVCNEPSFLLASQGSELVDRIYQFQQKH